MLFKAALKLLKYLFFSFLPPTDSDPLGFRVSAALLNGFKDCTFLPKLLEKTSRGK